jgi:hypothetical protein
MIQKSYNEFILEKIEDQIIYLIEESVFVMSDDLYKLINDMSDGGDRQPQTDDPVKEIARIFIRLELENVDSNVSYLDLSVDNNTISFIDADKGDKYRKENEITIKKLFDSDIGKNNIRVGRLVRKVIDVYNRKFNKSVEFSDSDIELFVNSYKSHYDYKNNKMSNFRVLKGSDISSAYLDSNYSNNKGTLGNSCMKYEDCQSYFELYTKSESCRLLVLYCPNKKITGRAILWETVDGLKLMDRIYTNDDSDVNLFIKWAVENGYLYKIQRTVFNDGTKDIQIEATIKVFGKIKNGYFPYLDTFKYFYPEEEVIRNYKKEGHYVILEDTTGDVLCYNCDQSGYVECDVCHGYGLADESKCTRCGGDEVITCNRCGGFSKVD